MKPYHLKRRSLLFSTAAGLLVGAAGMFIMHAGRKPSARLNGVDVAHWGCQYQNIDIGQIARSSLDMIAVDPVVQGRRLMLDEAPLLKKKPDGSKRLVLAYLSVGEAESYRNYWNAQWTSQPPAWLGPENPRWPGSYAVKYWHDDWRTLLLGSNGALASIIEAGFDGVFLDRVDAYGDWPSRGVQAQRDMIELVTALSAFAEQRSPEFLFLAQNAEVLLDDDRYCMAIDAVSKESLLYNLRGANLPNTDDDIKWSISYLSKAMAKGLPVFAIEYLSDKEQKSLARSQLAKLGMIPFLGNRLLDSLPEAGS